MSRILKIIVLFVSFFIMGSCLIDYSSNEEFVRKYKDENFDKFINTSFLIRSLDKDGDLVIFVNLDFQNASNQGPYILTIEKETGKVKSTSTKLMKDSINVNEKTVQALALEFLRYDIYSLAVDEGKNVYLRLEQAERPTLIRFSDPKSMNKEERRNWRRIEGNWYEKK